MKQRVIWEVRDYRGYMQDRFSCLFWAMDCLFWCVPDIGTIVHLPTGIEVYRGLGYDIF